MNKVKEKIVNSKSFKIGKKGFRYLITPLIFLGTFFGFKFFKLVYSYIHPPRIPIDKTPTDFGMNYENVNFRTSDNVEIRGWFIPAKEKGKPTIIFCHGYPANRLEVLNRAEFFYQKYNLLLFDFRGLGESGGFYSSFGVYEQRDLIAAINYLKKRDDISEKIGIFGFSMGGAVTLMAASNFPKEVKAIVVESPYSSLEGIIHFTFRQKIWQEITAQIAVQMARLFLRINIKNFSPVEAVKSIKIPLLIIHSRDDRQIPFEDSKRIFESANEPKFFWAPLNSDHGRIVVDYKIEYKRRMEEFFTKYLK